MHYAIEDRHALKDTDDPRLHAIIFLIREKFQAQLEEIRKTHDWFMQYFKDHASVD
jgi:hypothetical protein